MELAPVYKTLGLLLLFDQMLKMFSDVVLRCTKFSLIQGCISLTEFGSFSGFKKHKTPHKKTIVCTVIPRLRRFHCFGETSLTGLVQLTFRHQVYDTVKALNFVCDLFHEF